MTFRTLMQMARRRRTTRRRSYFDATHVTPAQAAPRRGLRWLFSDLGKAFRKPGVPPAWDLTPRAKSPATPDEN